LLEFCFYFKRLFFKNSKPRLVPSTGILCSQSLNILVLIFKPLEELSFINRKFKETKINFKDKDDFLFKPGLYKMTNVFLKGTKTSLPSLKDHTLNIKKYYRFFLKNNTL